MDKNKVNYIVKLEGSITESSEGITFSYDYMKVSFSNIPKSVVTILKKLSSGLCYEEITKSSIDPIDQNILARVWNKLIDNNFLSTQVIFNNKKIFFNSALKVTENNHDNGDLQAYSTGCLVHSIGSDVVMSNTLNNKEVILRDSSMLDLDLFRSIQKDFYIYSLLVQNEFFTKNDTTEIHNNFFINKTNSLMNRYENVIRESFTSFNTNPSPSKQVVQTIKQDLWDAFYNRHSYSNIELDNKMSKEVLVRLFSIIFQNLDSQLTSQKVRRVYPSAGGVYEISPILVCRDNSILPIGIYSFDNIELSFNLLSSNPPPIKSEEAVPRIVIQLALDTSILVQKYERISHKLALQNSGVILAYLYLTATNLGLRGYARGMEDSSTLRKISSENTANLLIIGEFHLP